MARWPVGPLARLPANRLNRPKGTGQALLEYAVLLAAVTSALLVMSDYIRRAFNANAEAIQNELSGE